MQLEIEVLDHPETADVELAQHAAILDRSADVPGQVELLAEQRVERWRLVPTHQAGRDGRTADLDLRTDGKLQALAPIRRQQPRLVAHDLDSHTLVGRQHE